MKISVTILKNFLSTYTKRYQNKPQCLLQDTFAPKAYRLDGKKSLFFFINLQSR